MPIPQVRAVLQLQLIALVALLSMVATRNLAGQVASIEASAGIAIPRAGLDLYHGAGPAIRAGVVLGRPSYAVRVRLDYEAAWMSGDEPESSYLPERDLRIVSVSGSGLIKVWDRGVTAYVILGGGIARISVRDDPRPPGSIFTSRTGVGVRRRRGRFGWQVELTPSVVFTEHATGGFFELVTFAPVTAGIFF